MSIHFRKQLVLALVMSITALSIFASQASAKDRNNDGIRDSWESRHGLSLKVNQARRDQDKDGVNNKCEFQSKSNPRRADSDDDGAKDGVEDNDHDGISNRGESRLHSHCGHDSNEVEVHTATIKSFENGVLSIDLGGGGTLSAEVSDTLKCERHVSSAPATSSENDSDDGPNHDDGDDHGGDDHSGSDSGPSGSSDDSSDDDDSSEACTTADLIVGAKVQEAKIYGGKFVKIELAS